MPDGLAHELRHGGRLGEVVAGNLGEPKDAVYPRSVFVCGCGTASVGAPVGEHACDPKTAWRISPPPPKPRSKRKPQLAVSPSAAPNDETPVLDRPEDVEVAPEPRRSSWVRAV
jgi:hypothetical protein